MNRKRFFFKKYSCLTSILFVFTGSHLTQAMTPEIVDHLQFQEPNRYLSDPANYAESTFTYKNSTPPMTLHVHYPPDWQPSDKRPVIIGSYGSGWKGNPGTTGAEAYLDRWDEKALRFAAKYAMVGVVFDYRGSNSSPSVNIEGSISDAKSAIRWVRKNAARLGVDTSRIITGGSSSGGHLSAAAVVFPTLYDDPTDEKSISAASKLHICMNCIMGDNSRGSGVSPSKYAISSNLQHGFPPTVIMFGSADGWKGSADVFVDSANKYGVEYDYKLVAGENHDFDLKGRCCFDTTLNWGVQFMAAYGYIDYQPVILPKDTADFSSLKKAIEDYCRIKKLGNSNGVTFTSEGGGTINSNGIFVAGTTIGTYRIRAKSVAFPNIKRIGYARIAHVIDDPTAGQFTATSGWTQTTASPSSGVLGTKYFSIGKTAGTLTFNINPPTSGYYGVYYSYGNFGFGSARGSVSIKDKFGEKRSAYIPKAGLCAISSKACYFEANGSGTVSFTNVVDDNGGMMVDAVVLVPALGSRSQEPTNVNTFQAGKINHLKVRNYATGMHNYNLSGKKITTMSKGHHTGLYLSKDQYGQTILRYMDK